MGAKRIASLDSLSPDFQLNMENYSIIGQGTRIERDDASVLFILQVIAHVKYCRAFIQLAAPICVLP